MGINSQSLRKVAGPFAIVVLGLLTSACENSHRSTMVAVVVGFRDGRTCVVTEPSNVRYERVSVRTGCYLPDPKSSIELAKGDCIKVGLAYLLKWPTETMSVKRLVGRTCDIPETVVTCLWNHMQSVEEVTGVQPVAKWNRDHPPCSSLK